MHARTFERETSFNFEVESAPPHTHTHRRTTTPPPKKKKKKIKKIQENTLTRSSRRLQKSTSMEENSARDKRPLKEDARELSSLRTSTWSSSKTARTEKAGRAGETPHRPLAAAAQSEEDKEGAGEALPLSTWSEKETGEEKEETSKCAL